MPACLAQVASVVVSVALPEGGSVVDSVVAASEVEVSVEASLVALDVISPVTYMLIIPVLTSSHLHKLERLPLAVVASAVVAEPERQEGWASKPTMDPSLTLVNRSWSAM